MSSAFPEFRTHVISFIFNEFTLAARFSVCPPMDAPPNVDSWAETRDYPQVTVSVPVPRTVLASLERITQTFLVDSLRQTWAYHDAADPETGDEVCVFTSCHTHPTLREAFRVAMDETKAFFQALRDLYEAAEVYTLRRNARLAQRDEAIRLALVDAPRELVLEPEPREGEI